MGKKAICNSKHSEKFVQIPIILTNTQSQNGFQINIHPNVTPNWISLELSSLYDNPLKPKGDFQVLTSLLKTNKKRLQYSILKIQQQLCRKLLISFSKTLQKQRTTSQRNIQAQSSLKKHTVSSNEVLPCYLYLQTFSRGIDINQILRRHSFQSQQVWLVPNKITLSQTSSFTQSFSLASLAYFDKYIKLYQKIEYTNYYWIRCIAPAYHHLYRQFLLLRQNKDGKNVFLEVLRLLLVPALFPTSSCD
eukprot:TRINITY_DN20473_c0_g1_i2.p1 TRINITY_DN20473_c0_g1~~TRINITY_DN20473_c0_g1_i2.p1  ORF type:complete len:248 (-),score=-23.90 TRINITY_DN20473_c0_g1_i2:32-775(-)